LNFTGTIQNWDEAVLTSASNTLSSIGSFLPSLIGAIVILVVGFIAANLVGALVTRVLVSLRFNQLADRVEINSFIRNTGARTSAAELVGKLGYWFVLIVAFLAAADTLGLHQVTAILGNIIFYVPNVIVAMVVLVTGALVGDLLANVVRGTLRSASLETAETLARVTRWIVIIFAVLLAMDQLKITPNLIEILFSGFVAALALALGLSFGLGGQSWAAGILAELTKQSKEVIDSRADAKSETRRSGTRTPSATSRRRGRR